MKSNVIVSAIVPLMLVCFCELGCTDEMLGISDGTDEPVALGSADSGSRFFNPYFISADGEVVSDDSLEVGLGDTAALKFFAPRDYGFEGGITAYLVDVDTGRIPYGTAYDVNCGPHGDWYIVREDVDTASRDDEPVCQISTDNLYPGEYGIRFEFFEYTYEGDWDWSSTRTLETGTSSRFSVVSR